MISYLGLSGKIVTRANRSQELFKMSWEPVGLNFSVGIGFQKTYGMIIVERNIITSYLTHFQRERLHLKTKHGSRHENE